MRVDKLDILFAAENDPSEAARLETTLAEVDIQLRAQMRSDCRQEGWRSQFPAARYLLEVLKLLSEREQASQLSARRRPS
jgi:hypothetical protein